MANLKLSRSNSQAITKALKEKCKKIISDKTTMKSVIQAAAVPVVKEVLQKHTQSDVVDKPFVDSKGRYRYFVVHHGSDNPQFIMAGTGRLQSNSYKKMAELTYIQAEMQDMRDNGTQWIFPVELYNNFPIGRSIYGTPNDPNVLLADRIIKGEIFMPPALDKNTILSDEAWEAYKNGQLGENRYEERNFYNDALNEMMSSETKAKIITNVQIEIMKRIKKQ